MRRYADVHEIQAVRKGYPAVNGGTGIGNVMTTTRAMGNPLPAQMLPMRYSQNGRSIERAGFMDVDGGNGLGNTDMPGILGHIRQAFSRGADYDDSTGMRRSHPLAGVGDLGTDYGGSAAYATTGPSLTTGSTDLSTLSTPTVDISSGTQSLATSSTLTNSLTNLATGVISSLASAAVTSALTPGVSMSAALLAQNNAARIAAGEVPLNANGTPMTAAQMAAAGYSNAQISSVGLMSSSDLLLIAGGAALLIVVLMATHKKS